MTDPREDFMMSLEKTLKGEESGIRHVGVWNQDIDYLEEDAPIPLPALYVEFMPITWEPIKESHIMRGRGEVRFHIITEWQSPQDDFEAFRISQNVFDVIDLVDSLSDSFSLSNPLQTITNHNHGDVMESIEVLSGRYCRYYG